MTSRLRSTGERMVPAALRSAEDHVLFERHLFAYRLADRELPADCLVLEVGAGEGYGCRLLGERRRVVGLEPDPAALLHAARRAASGNPVFARGAGDALPFPASTFDALVSFQVIEHVDEDVRFVSELARVLQPGGVALLTTPNRDLRLAPGQRPWNRFHRREYAAADFRALLGRAFSEVHLLGIGAVQAVHEMELARVRRIRRLVALDPLALRRLLPAPVATALRGIVRRLWLDRHAAVPSAEAPAPLSADAYFLTQLSTGRGLDLLAFCRGPGRR
jgi:SAM-dependent methyltransferase